jgi:hypothetical protein
MIEADRFHFLCTGSHSANRPEFRVVKISEEVPVHVRSIWIGELKNEEAAR